MSDWSDDGTITEGWRALDLFTNRESLSWRFLAYLNDDPAPDTILFLHAAGGNGKTLLLDYYYNFLCKRLEPDNWAHVQTLPADEAVAQVAATEAATPVPVARLDFASHPTDGYAALLKLRRDFGGSGLRFPLFDFAVVTHLYRTHRFDPTTLGASFPTNELDLINELVGLFETVPFVSLIPKVLGVLDRRLGGWFARERRRRKLDQADYLAIMRMDPEKELIRELPRFFAEDLNAAMTADGAPTRTVLLFDTHEAFWGHERDLSPDQYFDRDGWLRRLLSLLDRTAGIVTVVAGREGPRWPDAPRGRIPRVLIELHLVGNLTDGDADRYLRLAGVDDAAIRWWLREDARVGPDQVHPFALGLGVDLVQTAERRGIALSVDELPRGESNETRRQLLVDRLLRYVDRHLGEAIRAISVCRTFDRAIYTYLGRALGFPTDRAGFAILTGFSFVQPVADAEPPRFQTHQLLKRLLDDEASDIRAEADAAMEAYYRQRMAEGDEEAIVDAIYHANRQDGERGITEWLDVFERAIGQSRYARCRALLEIRSELRPKTAFQQGGLAQAIGGFHAVLSNDPTARTEFVASIAAFDAALAVAPDDVPALTSKGAALQALGELHAVRSQYADAEANYGAALTAYDAALAVAPDDVGALSHKGTALQVLGALQAELSLHRGAEASFGAAVAAFDAALAVAPDHVGLLTNKGVALQALGALQAELSLHRGAEASFGAAVAAFDAALAVAPNDIPALNDKGITLQVLGELHAVRSRHGDAEANYAAAVAAFDAVLAVAPDDVSTLTNKGTSLQVLGALQAGRSQYADAEANYAAAVAVYDAVLAVAPDQVVALTGKGNALQALGTLHTVRLQYADAEASFGAALTVYDTAFAVAPDDVSTLTNKGNALQALGALHAVRSQYADAEASFGAALTAYHAALVVAPDQVVALTGKGNALQALGELQAVRSLHWGAEANYGAAVAAFDAALAVAPDDVRALTGKGNALQALGELHAVHSRHGEAEANYGAALTAFDAALAVAPDDVGTLFNKGSALRTLGELHAVRLLYRDAEVSFVAALTAFDAALAVAPDYVPALTNKGSALRTLGHLQARRSEHADAEASYSAALAAYDAALALAPDDPTILEDRARLSELLELVFQSPSWESQRPQNE